MDGSNLNPTPPGWDMVNKFENFDKTADYVPVLVLAPLYFQTFLI